LGNGGQEIADSKSKQSTEVHGFMSERTRSRSPGRQAIYGSAIFFLPIPNRLECSPLPLKADFKSSLTKTKSFEAGCLPVFCNDKAAGRLTIKVSLKGSNELLSFL
jgi:hypothetical protein